ncbi:MAG: hypothetical protein ACRENW_01185, partial [Thermodesulfobacteriota bacterium]
MNSSVSTTLVTVCAFKRSCSVINVSMSTSGLLPSFCFGEQLRRIESNRGAAQVPANRHLPVFTGLQTRLHFSERSPKSQAETILGLNARCDGPDQFEKFDHAFRSSLNVSKAALLKEEARLKRARVRKRAKKHG